MIVRSLEGSKVYNEIQDKSDRQIVFLTRVKSANLNFEKEIHSLLLEVPYGTVLICIYSSV